jgi:uncharacterized protein YukE
MHRSHFLKLPLLLLILGSIPAQSQAAGSESEATLKAKGLSKVLSTWVIEDEKPVLASMKEAKAVFKSYAEVADRQLEAEGLTAQSKMLDQQRSEIQANLNALNQQIAQMPNRPAGGGKYAKYYQQTANNNPLMAERSQLNSAMTELNNTQKMIKSQIPTPQAKSSLDAEVSKRKDAFKSTLEDLRKQIDTVKKKYEELGADESIKKSIEDLAKTSHAKVKLGPSEAFATMAREVDQAERKYLGKAAPASTTTKKKAKGKK